MIKYNHDVRLQQYTFFTQHKWASATHLSFRLQYAIYVILSNPQIGHGHFVYRNGSCRFT